MLARQAKRKANVRFLVYQQADSLSSDFDADELNRNYYYDYVKTIDDRYIYIEPNSAMGKKTFNLCVKSSHVKL